MIRINADRALLEKHAVAVLQRVKMLNIEEEILGQLKALGQSSIEEFISSDIDCLRNWVENCPEKLQFSHFKKIYSSYFSKGAETFLAGNYNAYTFLAELDISVCPYCDDEYLDIVDVNGKRRRTCEIEHFFPKSKYPALAMSFYNLIPAGKNCNSLKLEEKLGMSPYEEKIEDMTFLFPDIPLGLSLDYINPRDCLVKFHPKKGMRKNVETLALEERYVRHAAEAHRLLSNLQKLSDEKIEELEKMGFGSREEIISSNFGPQQPEEKKKSLRQKMLKDLTGY